MGLYSPSRTRPDARGGLNTYRFPDFLLAFRVLLSELWYPFGLALKCPPHLPIGCVVCVHGIAKTIEMKYNEGGKIILLRTFRFLLFVEIKYNQGGKVLVNAFRFPRFLTSFIIPISY